MTIKAMLKRADDLKGEQQQLIEELHKKKTAAWAKATLHVMSELTTASEKPKLSSLHRQSSDAVSLKSEKSSPSLSVDSAQAAGPRGPASGGFGKQFGRAKTTKSLVQPAVELAG